MLRQNSPNSNCSSLQRDMSSLNGPNQSLGNIMPGSLLNTPRSPQPAVARQPLQLHQCGPPQQNHASMPQSCPPLQQMIQQLLEDMSKNNGADGQRKLLSGQNPGNHSSARNSIGLGNARSEPTAAGSNMPQSDSFKAASNSDYSSAAGGGNTGFNPKAPELPSGLQLADPTTLDMTHDFTENGFLSSDLSDDMGYGWRT
ncbi:hypothetical protein Nepgr_020249 [Nepenthes gracilis]|uniref:Uncharacterized protein n=1 Tax=Nepenthes gracilis TaxID=150966 RepID=A0AAD3SUM6_NEPGR|nr:hypothetical protein Nepgr_020249 [Nepenthes gracilis]